MSYQHRHQIRQETLGPVTDIYITPVAQYFPSDFLNEKAELEVLPPPSLPEGGTQGWMNVIGGLLVTFCTLGAVVSFGAYQDIYFVDFLSHSTPSEISLIGSTRMFLMFALSLPVGKFLDDGYFRRVVSLGTLLFIISQFVFAAVQANQFYQVFLIQGILGGLASGMLFLPVTSIIAQHFSVRRSMANSIVLMGSFLGGIVQVVSVNRLAPLHRGTHEFLTPAICLAIIYLVLLLVANGLLRPRPPQAVSGDIPQTSFWSEFMADGRHVAATVGIFLVLFGLFFPYFYLQLYTVDQGLSSVIVDNILIILNASAVLGCVIFMIPGTYYNSLSVLPLCSVALGVLTIGMLLLQHDTDVVIFAILYGFFSGGLVSLIGQVPLTIFQDERGLGARWGFWFFTVSGSVLIGPPLLGALLGSSDNFVWDRPIILSAVLMFIGAFFLSISRIIVALRKQA